MFKKACDLSNKWCTSTLIITPHLANLITQFVLLPLLPVYKIQFHLENSCMKLNPLSEEDTSTKYKDTKFNHKMAEQKL